MNAGYAGEMTKVPDWHGLVAWDLLLNNLTAGLFLTAALGELAAPEIFAPVARAAYPLALVLLVADLVCLVLDLGDPLRFHHMLRVFKPSSPMSLGTWCLTVYSLPLTVAAALSLFAFPGAATEWVRRIAAALGILPALGVAIYKGVLLSTNSQPGWKDARWFGAYLANSAILLGCAVTLVLAVFLGQEEAAALLRAALVLLLLPNGVFLTLILINVIPALRRSHTAAQLWRLWALNLGIPVAVFCLVFGGNNFLVMLVGLQLLLIGSLAIRFAIIKLPHVRSHRSHEN